MRCFQARCGPPELAEGLLPLSEGDVLVHVENTESNGWHLGICNGNVGFFCFDDVVSTELPASSDDVAIFLDIQRSHNTARRDSQTSTVSASSSAVTAATIKTSRERSINPRPSLGDSNGELASFLHSDIYSCRAMRCQGNWHHLLQWLSYRGTHSTLMPMTMMSMMCRRRQT
jgi:hypothetical protein